MKMLTTSRQKRKNRLNTFFNGLCVIQNNGKTSY
jgi:hypothetical protein